MSSKWPNTRQQSRRESRKGTQKHGFHYKILYFIIYSILFSIPVRESEVKLVKNIEVTYMHSVSSRSFKLLTKVQFVSLDNIIPRQ